ncbi:MAG: ABC transporter permease [Candidatus Latescibacterota bacterium]
MRKIMTLAWREYKAAVRTKGFIIGLVLMPIFMSGGFIAMKLSESHIDTSDKKIAVIDWSGKIADSIVQAAKTRNETEVYDTKKGKKVKPAYLIEIIETNNADPEKLRLELSDRIRAKKLHAFVEIGADVVHPAGNPERSRIAYHSKNAVMDDLRRWLSWPVNNQLRSLRLADAGIDESKIRDLFSWVNIDGLGLASLEAGTGKFKDAKRSNEGTAIGIPMIMIMLMFFMIILGANPLLTSVMEEKSQRIAEVLLGSINPFQFMMGKVIGGVGVSLTASAVYIIGGITAAKYMGLDAYIPYHLLPWFFALMILAVFLFGSMLAALGSACNDLKDVQSLALPAMLPMMIPMFIMTPVLREPLSAFSTWLSLFPPFTPMLMMLRLGTSGGIPVWQPFVGVVGVLLFTLFSVWAGGRIFRIGILMQGKPPKFLDILRWAVRG